MFEWVGQKTFVIGQDDVNWDEIGDERREVSYVCNLRTTYLCRV